MSDDDGLPCQGILQDIYRYYIYNFILFYLLILNLSIFIYTYISIYISIHKAQKTSSCLGLQGYHVRSQGARGSLQSLALLGLLTRQAMHRSDYSSSERSWYHRPSLLQTDHGVICLGATVPPDSS